MRVFKRAVKTIRESSTDRRESEHYDDYKEYRNDSARRSKAEALFRKLEKLVGREFIVEAVKKFCDETDYTDIADRVGYGNEDDRYDVGRDFVDSDDLAYQIDVIGKDEITDLIREVAKDEVWSKLEAEGIKIFRNMDGVGACESMEGADDPFDMNGFQFGVELDDFWCERLGLEPEGGTALQIKDGEAIYYFWDQTGMLKKKKMVKDMPNMSYMTVLEYLSILKEYTKYHMI